MQDSRSSLLRAEGLGRRNRIRKAKAWAACHKLKKMWKSDLKRSLKIRLFVSTVESILLYGAETWTLTERLEKQLDGCYTRMLRMALNVNWKQHLTNKEVYGNLPRATMKVQERRMRFAGHLHRHPELTANRLLLWEPKHGVRDRGRPATVGGHKYSSPRNSTIQPM